MEQLSNYPWKAALELIAVATTLWTRFCLVLAGVKIGSTPKFYGSPVFLRARNSRINIGDNFENRNLHWSNPLGISRPTVFCTWRPGARLTIGDNVGISGGSIVASHSIEIGDNTLIGADCLIIDTDFHPLNPFNRRYSTQNVSDAPVSIGRNVFIGMRSIILKGVTIGDNAVIGAGSVVASNVPPSAIVAGNPARLLSK